MAFQLFQCFFILFIMGLAVEAKIYNKCDFAKKMQSQGIKDKKALATWTCIAYNESRFNTKAINKQSGDYGILQISHLYWCADGDKPGKGCNISCKSLLGDDITKDITCAKKVYAETQKLKGNGFTAWVAYNNHCKGDQSKWLNGCKI